MNSTCLWLATLLYAGQGAVWIRGGLYTDALILGGYIIANIGLILKAGNS